MADACFNDSKLLLLDMKKERENKRGGGWREESKSSTRDFGQGGSLGPLVNSRELS